MKDDKDISVTRAVGRFFGHIWGASTTPVSAKDSEDTSEGESKVVNHDVQEAESSIDGKKVVLRRTTIDEVEIRED
ncbi:MAG: hypothetical protein P1U42_05870 [Phycisphaerales bacterium]|nr:hypothetical protein [Phycisphaerales bacterium]